MAKKFPMGMRVIIIIDCRSGKNCAGEKGKIIDHVTAIPGIPIPKIELDSGDVIHGYECWWKPYKEPVDRMYV